MSCLKKVVIRSLRELPHIFYKQEKTVTKQYESITFWEGSGNRTEEKKNFTLTT